MRSVCTIVYMSTQMPTITVNVRLDPATVAAIDAYCDHLRAKRVARVSRSDLLRLALHRLPAPGDADPDLVSLWAGVTGPRT